MPKTVMACVLLALGVVALGGLVADDKRLAIAAALFVLAFGLFAADQLLWPILALPGTFLLQRVGSASTNLSVSDLLVFLGTLAALLSVDRKEAVNLRRFLIGVVVYQVTLVVVVAYHPGRSDIVEWFHRFFAVGGSAFIGWTIAMSGRVRQALRLYLFGAVVVAIVAMEHAVALHFAPAQWGVYQKNAIGSMMWPAIILTQFKPPWTELRGWTVRLAKYFCVGGLLASQSRQAAVVLIGVLVFAFLLQPEIRRRLKLMIPGLATLGVGLYFSFAVQLKDAPKFNSVATRLGQLSNAINVWHTSPELGQGLRFYYLHQFLYVTAPPNVIIDALASSGVIGLIGFLILVGFTINVMFRLPRGFGLFGLSILVGHYVQGLFDIFWVGAFQAGPFILAGICLGLSDRALVDTTRSSRLGDVNIRS